MSDRNMKRLAIFVSGSGTNMENLVKCVREEKLPAEISLIVCDRPEAYALERAKRFQLETFVVERKIFPSKEAFDAAISEKLKEKEIDLILLAGYMRIISCPFVREWAGRIVNIHPSFLPSFPGAHAIRDAFEAKVAETGVTVHFVDEGVDSGPIILQKKVPVLSGESIEALEKRVHELEYTIYPEALRLLLAGRVELNGRKVTIR